jgi:hypothetical protein
MAVYHCAFGRKATHQLTVTVVDDMKQVDVRPKIAKVARVIEKPVRQAVQIVERRRHAQRGRKSEAASHGRANSGDLQVRLVITLEVLEKHIRN